jgi:hypothetical protein
MPGTYRGVTLSRRIVLTVLTPIFGREPGTEESENELQEISGRGASKQVNSDGFYSMRSASMGSMLAARRAGMNPAKAAAMHNAPKAREMLTGS